MAAPPRTRTYHVFQRTLVGLIIVLLAVLAVIGWFHEPEQPEAFGLTLTACQFLEPEGGDQGFTRGDKNDCREINARTASERLAEARVFSLEPGRYRIRVTNRDVDAKLGFWLREEDYDFGNPFDVMHRTSVSASGLAKGETMRFTLKLEPGTYLYSDPVNPTPDYELVVESE